MSGIFDRFFKNHDQEVAEEEAAERGRAREILGIAQHVYIVQLLNWLDAEADRPLLGHDPMEIAKSAMRGNALREVRRRILRDFQNAKSVMQDEG